MTRAKRLPALSLRTPRGYDHERTPDRGKVHALDEEAHLVLQRLEDEASRESISAAASTRPLFQYGYDSSTLSRPKISKIRRSREGLAGRVANGLLRRVVAGPFEVDLGVNGVGKSRSHIGRGVESRIKEKKTGKREREKKNGRAPNNTRRGYRSLGS